MKARGSVSFSHVLSSNSSEMRCPTVQQSNAFLYTSLLLQNQELLTRVTSSIFHASPERMFGSVRSCGSVFPQVHWNKRAVGESWRCCLGGKHPLPAPAALWQYVTCPCPRPAPGWTRGAGAGLPGPALLLPCGSAAAALRCGPVGASLWGEGHLPALEIQVCCVLFPQHE